MVNKVFSWITLVASVCYVIAMLILYTNKYYSGFALDQKDMYRLFLLFVVCVAGYKASSSLIDYYRLGKSENHESTDFKLALSPGAVETLSNDSNLLSTAFNKRPWLFVAIFAFAFSLPLLFRLSVVGAAGRRFNTEDWWFVIGGEMFIGICLVVGWYRVKRFLKVR